MRSAPSGSFRVRRPRPPVTALATALLLVTGILGTAVGQTLGAAPAQAGAATAQVAAVGEGNLVTPGDFTGYGFDQCHAPDQRSMNKWMTYSPFLAVGIYISGNSRACRDQPNLTPEWISTQLAKGWRLLPITLGPQANCNPSFPRYGTDPVISGRLNKQGQYAKAFRQGTAPHLQRAYRDSSQSRMVLSLLHGERERRGTGLTRAIAFRFISRSTLA